MDSSRIFRPLLWLLILACGFLGLAFTIAPATFAALAGFAGTDLFTYRLAGAALFAYAAGLTAGSQASWAELRIPIASTFAFGAAAILACLLSLVGGGAPLIVVLVLALAIGFTAFAGQVLRESPIAAAGKARAELERPIGPWVVGLFTVGVAAAAVFGLGPLLLGGEFGSSSARAATTRSSTGLPALRPSARPWAASSSSSRGAGRRRGSQP